MLPSAAMAADGAPATEAERVLQSKIAYTMTALPIDRRVAYLLNYAFQVRPVALAHGSPFQVGGRLMLIVLAPLGAAPRDDGMRWQELSTKVHTLARARALLVLLQVASPADIEPELALADLRCGGVTGGRTGAARCSL